MIENRFIPMRHPGSWDFCIRDLQEKKYFVLHPSYQDADFQHYLLKELRRVGHIPMGVGWLADDVEWSIFNTDRTHP